MTPSGAKRGATVRRRIEGARLRLPKWTAEQIPTLFVALALPLGIGYVFLMPPLQVADEGAHLVRAYGISQGHCIATVETMVPRTLDELEARFPDHVESVGRVTMAELRNLLRAPLHSESVVPATAVASNLYSCVPYMFEASVLRFGTMWGASPLALLYLARLANLGAFIAITWLALRMLPDFRLLLLLLALMPMTLHQAASASADGFSTAATFFLCAYVLRLAFDGRNVIVQRLQYLVLIAAVVAVSLAKFNIWLILLVFLIPAAKLGSSRARWLALAACVVCACGAAFAWQYANRHNIETFRLHTLGSGVDQVANARRSEER